MGSEGSHNTQNDTPLVPSAKKQKKEGKRVALQAKVDELEAQNNKIAMKNETYSNTRARYPYGHQPSSGCPQHGGSPSFDMGISDEERANHQNIDQHETSLNPAAST
ncbi:hypothetical protein PS2_013044 [Malus domestica]